MRKRTIAVLVLFWSALSAVLWAHLYPLVFAWVTLRLADFGLHQATWIAATASGACLLSAAAVVTFLMAMGARPASPVRGRSAPGRVTPTASAQAPSERALSPIAAARSAGQTSVPLRTDGAISSPFRRGTSTGHAARRRICIKPDKTLVHSGLRFGFVRVADASDRAKDDGPQSEEIYFKKRDDRGTLIAQVPYDGRGFQFKCFVDYRGARFDRVKRALLAGGFTKVTPRPNKEFRAWFMLPNYRARKTIGDQTYNIV
jgi:hypothetical protein